MQKTIILMLALLVIACKKQEISISQDEANFQKKLQESLLTAKPGSVINLPAGTFRLDRALTLAEKGVTIKGAGMDKTILSFKGQKEGAAGLLVSQGDFLIEDLTIQDTTKDAIKINGAKNVTVRRVKTEWTSGPQESNGAYGIYPVQCENVLVEDSVAIGASDAGIYIGQSRNIIVRRNRAEQNVAGIEIENSVFADVYENVATNNTGGILVFDLPDLPVQGGKNTRIFKNEITKNNTKNFAPSGNIVATVPNGTGLMIMANDNIEAFENTITDNITANILVVSYLITDKPIKDKNYDPYPESIHVHNNKVSGGGKDPTGGNNLASKVAVTGLKAKLGEPFPQMLWDGIVNKTKYPDGLPKDKNICFRDNGPADFANFDAPGNMSNIKRDLAAHNCSYPPIAPISIPGVK
ncbi:MAG: right-handed parallel beta-helix repeat-containing protein [Leptospirales bacterium]|nr:right-handed parallel beta-helix repeat-containing protein [Leptospirales bacterium]